jgi:hypothetical protein
MAIALDSRSYFVEIPVRSAQLPQAVYVRRRLVVAMVGLSLVLAACLGLRGLANHADDPASVPVMSPVAATGLPVAADALSAASVQGAGFYVVQSGDTLWSIASSLTDGSIRSYVKKLAALNGGESVRIGQRLTLPND